MRSALRGCGSCLYRAGSGLAGDPVWSPDGELIAFRNTNDRSGYGMYVIRPDGTHLRRVANGFLLFPFWRP